MKKLELQETLHTNGGNVFSDIICRAIRNLPGRVMVDDDGDGQHNEIWFP